MWPLLSLTDDLAHTVLKSQPASMKVKGSCIWAVVRPVPPELEDLPEAWTSQNELEILLAELLLLPIRPPVPFTWPVE